VAAALARGCVPGEWHSDREPIEWAVKATVGGMTYEQIAAEEWRITPEAVAKHVKRLLRLIGLRRMAKRPRK
jgi:DNA-binding NarL/FixJ family response regulator